MTVVVFAGPTISTSDVRTYIQADVRPPVSQGDVYRAARDGAGAIGIVDGYFDRVPAVWHKEILWALSRGVSVYGSASMGALRAAELCPFGMVGVGAIFESFRSGALEDDDEVAITHSLGDTGFRPVSEAMVNIRATVARAQELGVIAEPIASALIKIAKSAFYPERTYPRLIASSIDRGLPAADLNRFREWVRESAVNQKRTDALAMLTRMATDLDAPRATAFAAFPFELTDSWLVAVREMDRRIAP